MCECRFARFAAASCALACRTITLVVREVETIGDVDRTPGIYAMYGGDQAGRGWVAYVGIAGNLHRRLEQHVIRRDSSVVTGIAPSANAPKQCRPRNHPVSRA